MKPLDFNDLKAAKHPHRRLRLYLKRLKAMSFLDGVRVALQPGSVVVDCGANVGEVSTFLAPTGATIHAFEPDPTTYAELQTACADYSNITLHEQACGVRNETLQLFRSEGFTNKENASSLASSVVPDNKRAASDDTVPVTSINLIEFLQDLIASHGRIVFLKIDIEGAELEILEDMIKTDIFENIGATVVETHEWLFKDKKPRYRVIETYAKDNPQANLYLDWI